MRQVTGLLITAGAWALAESRTECRTETEPKDREMSDRPMLEEAQRMRAATPGGAPAGLGP